MTSTTSTEVVFSLPLPAGWEELDVRPETRDRSIAFIVGERVKAVPQLASRRADIVAYLRDLARIAWDNGTRYCGTFIAGGDDGIVPGSVTVSILPPAPTTGSSNLLDPVIEQLQDLDQPSGDYWTQTTTVTLKHADRAARTYGVQPVQVPGSTQLPIPVVLMNTYVPFNGGVALIACGSPAAAAAEPLLELFDIVTDHFRFHPAPSAVPARA